MVENKKGSIVNISSIVGLTGAFGQTNYAASKAAIIGFTKSLAKEVAKYNIRINAVAPGYVETDMTNKIAKDISDKIKSNIPMKRFAKPEEIGKAIYQLANMEYVTGEVLSINGGLL